MQVEANPSRDVSMPGVLRASIVVILLGLLGQEGLGQTPMQLRVSLRRVATKWLRARQNVLKTCGKCRGVGSYNKPIVTRNGLVTRKVACGGCSGAGAKFSSKDLRGIYDPYLERSRYVYDLFGQRVTASSVRNVLGGRSRQQLQALKDRLGWIRGTARVIKVELDDRDGVISATVNTNVHPRATQWGRIEGAWCMLSPDELSRHRALSAPPQVVKRKVATKIGKEFHLGRWKSLREAARSVATLLEKHPGSHTHRLLSIDKVERSGVEKTVVVLNVNYRELAPTDAQHSRHLQEEVCRLIAAMQDSSWPKSVPVIALQATYTVISPLGQPSNRPVTRIWVDRSLATDFVLDNLDHKSVFAVFVRRNLVEDLFRHLTGRGWKLWFGKKVR